MATIADASLSEAERRVLARFVELLEAELGSDVRAVWLYGSRARGERAHDESDVDLLVVGNEEKSRQIDRLLIRSAAAEGTSVGWFSAHVYSPERVAQRREIRSFFIQEVDRDKIVLYGEA